MNLPSEWNLTEETSYNEHYGQETTYAEFTHQELPLVVIIAISGFGGGSYLVEVRTNQYDPEGDGHELEYVKDYDDAKANALEFVHRFNELRSEHLPESMWIINDIVEAHPSWGRPFNEDEL